MIILGIRSRAGGRYAEVDLYFRAIHEPSERLRLSLEGGRYTREKGLTLAEFFVNLLPNGRSKMNIVYDTPGLDGIDDVLRDIKILGGPFFSRHADTPALVKALEEKKHCHPCIRERSLACLYYQLRRQEEGSEILRSSPAHCRQANEEAFDMFQSAYDSLPKNP